MTDINVVFCRQLLKSVMKDVKKHTTAAQRKTSEVICMDRRPGYRSYEFHVRSEDFYWFGGADNAADARYHGWHSYLRSINAPGYSDEEN